MRLSTRLCSTRVSIGGLQYSTSWLRDHCGCSQCVDPVSQQKLHASGTMWPSPEAASCHEEGGQFAEVQWSGPGAASHPRTRVALRSLETGSGPVWDGALALRRRQAAVPLVARPSVAWAHVAADDVARAWLLNTLHGTGLCLVTDVPAKVGSAVGVTALADRVARVMHTFYGHHWELRYEEGAQNLAYSALALDWHQDLLYFEAPPGVQLLHCLEQAESGGATLFLDGVKAAEDFQAQHAEEYDLLSRVRIPYHYRAMGVVLDQQRSVFAPATSEDGHRSVFWSPHWQATLPVQSAADHERLYRALHAFHTFLERQPQLALRLQPGEAVVFDNRRMLHARSAFSGRRRHLQGCYVSHDDFRVALASSPVRDAPFAPSERFVGTHA